MSETNKTETDGRDRLITLVGFQAVMVSLQVVMATAGSGAASGGALGTGGVPSTGGASTDAGTAASGGTSNTGGVGGTTNSLVTAVFTTPASDWDTGYCTTIQVTNASGRQVTDWTVVLDVGRGTVASIWDVDALLNGTQIMAHAKTSNAALAPAASTKFGFCALTPDNKDRATIVSITATTATTGAGGVTGTGGKTATGGTTATGGVGGSTGAVTAIAKMSSDWNTGYCAQVDVKNGRSSAITGWTVVVNIGQSTVYNLWNAHFTASGSLLTVTPLSSNQTLASGQSTYFGFCGVPTGTHYKPVVVSVQSTP
jgi:cellulase/cellobiase CelA1